MTATARAHPRSRGEHDKSRGAQELQLGSSPLARGARHSGDPPCRLDGLIPARAGSTGSSCAPPSAGWAHPRSRGEHPRLVTAHRVGGGSSPLARGAHHLVRDAVGVPGLIPARAGSTGSPAVPRGPPGAHPRSRGEHPVRLQDGRAYTRLIPARAGSTGASGPSGESPAGSSLLARGAQVSFPENTGGWGLIPARAGSTRHHHHGRRRPWAHPRSRGEHKPGELMTLSPLGSSPLARGARVTDDPVTGGGGLIPARAGSTSALSSWTWATTAHPRSRGEHWGRP